MAARRLTPGPAEGIAWRDAVARFSGAAYDSVREPLGILAQGSDWPTLDALNALADGVTIPGGLPIRFVPCAPGISAMQYESAIARSGEVPTRERNWHDLFNALSWLAFQQLKSAISRRHAHYLGTRANESTARSVERDTLTLLDEGGMLVASDDASLLALIRDFRWRELFVARRAEARQRICWLVAGHAILEKSLTPHIGATARALLFEVPSALLDAPPARRRAALDALAARWVEDPLHLASTRNLSPLPYLGIPGWDAANEDAAFYDNSEYFRPGRAFDRSAARRVR